MGNDGLLLERRAVPTGRIDPMAKVGGTSGQPDSASGWTVGTRPVALMVAAAVVVAGILFTFFWYPVSHQGAGWVTQGDLWGIYRGAQYVSWGDLGGIYNQDTGIVTLPGIAVVLAPVAMLCDALHLSSLAPGFFLPHPTAALVLVPTELVLASTVVIAADALAEQLAVAARRRVVLCVAVGVVTWGVAAIWGHPEDALVMTFAMYAFRAVLRGSWVRAGWLFGIGVAFQPLLALVLPLFVAASPRAGRALFAIRCSAIAVILAVVAYVGNPSGVVHSLIGQPTPPGLNHVTPWVSLAPHERLGPSLWVTRFELVRLHGEMVFIGARAVVHAPLEVAGGPGRFVYLALAVLAGLAVWRNPPDPLRLLWLAAAVLAARCCFEAVMTPYYVTPPLVLLVVLAGRTTTIRFVTSIALSLGISWFAYADLGPWEWWLPQVTGLGLILWLTVPGKPPRVTPPGMPLSVVGVLAEQRPVQTDELARPRTSAMGEESQRVTCPPRRSRA